MELPQNQKDGMPIWHRAVDRFLLDHIQLKRAWMVRHLEAAAKVVHLSARKPSVEERRPQDQAAVVVPLNAPTGMRGELEVHIRAGPPHPVGLHARPLPEGQAQLGAALA